MKDTYTACDIQSALDSLLKRLDELSSLRANALVFVHGQLMLHTRLQAIFDIRLVDPVQAQLFELILTHALAAERMGPGAFDECINRVIMALRGQNLLYHDDVIYARCPNNADIEEILLGLDVTVSNVLRSALQLAGFCGRIIIEKTHGPKASVELCRGYNFDVSPTWQLSLNLEHPRVFIIDGYIEQVSEVHHLLEAASNANEYVVIFARGMSDDVLHTLRVNYDRGTLKVIPIMVKFDLEGINTMNDISVVTGSPLVSSNKGDVINNIQFESGVRVDGMVTYPTKVVIRHNSTAVSVSSQVQMLRAKRNETSAIEDVEKLYDRRIRSLSPNHVIIRIPDNRDYVRTSQTIDYTLRTVKAMVDHGVMKMGDRTVPSLTYIATNIHAERCVQTLKSLGAIVTAT